MVTKTIGTSKQEINRDATQIASKKIVFCHKHVSGTGINLQALNTPTTEMPTFIQPSFNEIAAAELFINKNSLDLKSSVRGPLILGLDYQISDSNSISFINGLLSTVEVGEIFVGKIDYTVDNIVAISAKHIPAQVYSLAVGQNIVNLGQQYAYNESGNGQLKVTINGVLAKRNTNNSTTTLDGKYYEINGGNGTATAIFINTAPTTTAAEIIVDFGIRAVTDRDAIDTIQSLAGSLLKVANDVSILTSTPLSNYMNVSPSEVDRRTFGDYVLSLLNRVTALESTKFPVGSKIDSLLTEAQFQAVMGTGWVLYNSGSTRNITGSALATLTGITSLGDAGGKVFRAKNNGAITANNNQAGDLALGTYQADDVKAHTHTASAGSGSTFNFRDYKNSGSSPITTPANTIDYGHGASNDFAYGPGSTRNDLSGTPNTASVSLAGSTPTINSTGGTENIVKSITINVFIRIN